MVGCSVPTCLMFHHQAPLLSWLLQSQMLQSQHNHIMPSVEAAQQLKAAHEAQTCTGVHALADQEFFDRDLALLAASVTVLAMTVFSVVLNWISRFMMDAMSVLKVACMTARLSTYRR